jgi:hypothetical protein
MHTLTAFVPVLGCGLMMAVCVGLVRIPRRHATLTSDESKELAQLRAEVDELRRARDRD